MTPELKNALINALRPIVSRVRTDVSAVKSPKGGSYWTDAPLDENTLGRHVNGGPARGACPIKPGESVTMLALLDFDSHGGETDWPEMQRAAGAVSDVLRANGYEPVAFRSSGGRGIHLYMLWDEPQDAYSVRCEMERCLESVPWALDELGLYVGFKNGTKGVIHRQVEVFPKQDEVGPGEFGNQFILPLAGHSEPLDFLLGLEPMGKEWVLGMPWPLSRPVPHRERPVRHELALLANVEPIEKVREALFAINNDDMMGDTPDYDEYRDIVFAVHEATGGSEEGFEVLQEWAQQNTKYAEEPKFLRDRMWAYVKAADNRTMAVTRATLYAKARGAGWRPASTADGFEDVPETVTRIEGTSTPIHEQAEPLPLPDFKRDPKTGSVKPVIGNLIMALRRVDITGVQIAYDRFRDEIMLAPPGTADWRPFTDADYVWLRERLEAPLNGFEPIGKEMVRDVVAAVAHEQAFDSAILWINSLEHDGVPRIDTFLSDYFGVEDTPYHRAVSRYMWTAMAGRVLQPGVKADMVPILVGLQGVGKSTAIESLVPSPEFFCEVSFSEKDDDLARKMRGKLVAEIGELRGLHTRELEAIKAFITRTHENWVPKFKEFATAYPRRMIFIGSTNQEQFLADVTGNRRWLPVSVGTVNVEGVRRVASTLWAEARKEFLAHGVAYREAERLGAAQHDQYSISDPWQPRVETWLAEGEVEVDGVTSDREHVTPEAALIGALRYEPKAIGQKELSRMGAVLKATGRIRKQKRILGKPVWGWVVPDTSVTTVSPVEE